MPNNVLKGTSYYSEGRSYSGSEKELSEVKKMIEQEPERQYVPVLQQNEYVALPLGSYLTGGMIVQQPGGQQAAQPTQPTNAEIDIKLQMILNSIPIADPGKIITSEYHNSLRDAVRAIASRIGLSVNSASEFKILSFAPNFQPHTPTASATTGGIKNTWEVYLLKATIPTAINPADSVRGGFVVQLPDNSTIFQMIVRGVRHDKDRPKPEKFNVTLNRLKLGTDKAQQTDLIDIDLSKLADGYFEEKGTVDLSAADHDTDTITTQNIIADRSFVNNKTHIYFVTAEWLAGANNAGAARAEITSIQILCAV